MPQVGVYSAYQLGIHNHLNNDNGGILNDYSRFGAYREAYRTGALAVHVDNDAEVNSLIGVYTLLKQFTVNEGQRGEFRLSWEMKNTDNLTAVHVRVAINDVDIPASDQTENTNVYQSKIYGYDVDLNTGDRVQLLGNANGDEVWIRSFRIYYDWSIKYFHDGTNGRVLVTPLALTDTTALDVTADF